MILSLSNDGHFKMCNIARCQINQQLDIFVVVAVPCVRHYSWNDKWMETVERITCSAEMAGETSWSVHISDIVLLAATIQLQLERHHLLQLCDIESVLLCGTLAVAVVNKRKWLIGMNGTIPSANLTFELYQSDFCTNLQRY
jgi:hypothetical protein